MAIISIWLSPSGTQGNPDSSVPRRYSPVTQAAGASHKARRAGARQQHAERRGAHRHVEPEVERQQEHADRPERRRQAAEGDQHVAGPVERAAEVDDRRHQAEPEAAARARPRQRARASGPSGQGEKERHQRNPGARRMAELREAQGKQRAGQAGEEDVSADHGYACSVSRAGSMSDRSRSTTVRVANGLGMNGRSSSALGPSANSSRA